MYLNEKHHSKVFNKILNPLKYSDQKKEILLNFQNIFWNSCECKYNCCLKVNYGDAKKIYKEDCSINPDDKLKIIGNYLIVIKNLFIICWFNIVGKWK